MANSRIITRNDLKFAGFEEEADDWAIHNFDENLASRKLSSGDFATLAEAVDTLPVGTYFTCAELGTLRKYKRVAGEPGYTDEGIDLINFPISADNISDTADRFMMTSVEKNKFISAEQSASLISEQPNLFTEGELNFTIKTLITGNSDTASIMYDEIGSWGLTAQAGTQKSYTRRFPRESLGDATTMSASLFVLSIDAASGGSGKVRWILIQRTSALVEIERQEIQIADQSGLTGPARPSISDIQIADNCSFIDFYIDISAVGSAERKIYFREMLFARGKNPYFRIPPSTVPNTVYVSPNGSDTNSGVRTSPLATLNAAADKLKGNGQIVLLAGNYTWTSSAYRLEPTKVLGHIHITGERGSSPSGYDTLPTIYCSNKLTGITKTIGYNKVYQVTISSPGSLSNFNHAFQDGVSDPRTIVTGSEILFPQLRGRTHWLPMTCMIKKTVATELSSACSEIDTSDDNDPRAFIENNTMYFSIVGGGDGTVANIYYAAAAGIIATGIRGINGKLTLSDIEVRYGGADVTPFRDVRIERSRFIGAKTDIVNYYKLSYHDVEFACAGALISLTGDGLNGHIGSHLSGSEIFSHHNNDDGLSPHEGSGGNPCMSGLVAYNGGAGIAVAYGANCTIGGDMLISYRNQRRADPNNPENRYKPAAFCVVGDPSEDGYGGDGGTSTNAIFHRCVSIEDYTSFYSDDAVGDAAYGWAIDCKSINSIDRGYNVTKISDCSHVGSSEPKHERTIVENTNIVT